jgi:hypothetical protein
MPLSAKALMMAIVAAALLAAATSTASARRLEVSNQGIRAVWPNLVLAASSAGENPSVTCSVTLEGTFHSRTFTKVSGALLGYITRAITNENACRGSSSIPGAKATVLLESLPWHIDYLSFEGSLPNITGISLLLLGIAFRIFNLPLQATCLYRGNARGIFIPALENRIQADETLGIPRVEGSVLCPNPGFWGGFSNTVTQLGNSTAITIRLI